jgi:hypothetical protein
MGLFVVARLARRGGFGVMLQSRPDASGTVAMVRVPPSLVIGAPGSTGEQPATGRTGGAALAQRSAPPALADRGFGPPALEPAPQPNGTLSPAAAAAAAGVRSAVGGDEDDSPLPRRNRPPRTSTPPGLDPAEIAAANSMTPPGGLFMPTTPPAAAETGEGRAIREEVRGGDYSRAAYQGYGQGLGDGDSYTGQIGSPATSPGGIQPLGEDAEPLGTPGGGLPRRGEDRGTPASPYARTDPSRGFEDDLPSRPTPLGGATGAITTTGSSSASALPAGIPPVPGTPAGGLGTSGLPVRPVGEDREGPRGGSLPTGGIGTQGPASGGIGTGGIGTGGIGTGGIGTGELRTGEAGSQDDGGYRSFGVESFGNEAEFGVQPLTAHSGEPKSLSNPTVPANGQGNGAAPAAWDDALPTELAARAAAASAYRPADPNAPMIGDDALPDIGDPTPIFDQISVWFSTEPTTGSLPVTVTVPDDSSEVIDLREPAPQQQPSSRWAALGDQRWLATNARAAAAPDTAGTTDQGLPKRRPGANLLPSAAAAAPPAAGFPQRGPISGPLDEIPRVTGADADQVRGRLGSYQRGLATARRARAQDPDNSVPAFDSVGAGLFTANRDPGEDAGQYSGDQGGDQ